MSKKEKTPVEITDECFAKALKIVRRNINNDIRLNHDDSAVVIAASNIAMILASYELEHRAIQGSPKESDDPTGG